MTQEEITKKSAALGELYAAMGRGETLQVFKTDTAKWWDLTIHDSGPNLRSELKWWRIKSEPRRMWQKVNAAGREEDSTTDPIRVMLWRQAGFTVTEWVEVIPE